MQTQVNVTGKYRPGCIRQGKRFMACAINTEVFSVLGKDQWGIAIIQSIQSDDVTGLRGLGGFSCDV